MVTENELPQAVAAGADGFKAGDDMVRLASLENPPAASAHSSGNN